MTRRQCARSCFSRPRCSRGRSSPARARGAVLPAGEPLRPHPRGLHSRQKTTSSGGLTGRWSASGARSLIAPGSPDEGPARAVTGWSSGEGPYAPARLRRSTCSSCASRSMPSSSIGSSRWSASRTASLRGARLPRGAKAVLELPAGESSRRGLAVGDRHSRCLAASRHYPCASLQGLPLVSAEGWLLPQDSSGALRERRRRHGDTRSPAATAEGDTAVDALRGVSLEVAPRS